MGMFSRATSRESKNNVVEIPDGILAALEEIARIRGISVEDIVRLQLTGYVNAFERGKVIGLHDKMPYGKYEGLLLKEIILGDPRYIAYLISNSDRFRVSEEAHKFIEANQ